MKNNNYQELYKKYRPRVFEDVIGQDVAIQQIKSFIINDKVPTGISLSAIAGSGKTTLSLIIAKTLNCKNLKDKTTPCNACEVCNAIDNNAQMGIKYFSAANSGSVEDVREIVKDAKLSYPIEKPVFIVDECHNLHQKAWDAMLIPLESEKMKTFFIFCTTEADKLPPAILSRIQNLSLPPVHYKTLAKHLYSILQKENLLEKVSKEEILICSQEARGSVRNALQNLETLLNDGKLPTNLTNELIKAMLEGNPANVLRTTNQMNESGNNFIKTMDTIYREFTSALQLAVGYEEAQTPLSLSLIHI